MAGLGLAKPGHDTGDCEPPLSVKLFGACHETDFGSTARSAITLTVPHLDDAGDPAIAPGSA
jgi:hypothetical protein